ncbi:uncharacterized protein LOC135195922 [Macrobrachium nipponense]|uniref:uncharacterized protein LOC135195922 n=1 Tax=Macrobrachium nipponense TaxID=159736 RepID=UPI0030C84F17
MAVKCTYEKEDRINIFSNEDFPAMIPRDKVNPGGKINEEVQVVGDSQEQVNVYEDKNEKEDEKNGNEISVNEDGNAKEDENNGFSFFFYNEMDVNEEDSAKEGENNGNEMDINEDSAIEKEMDVNKENSSKEDEKNGNRKEIEVNDKDLANNHFSDNKTNKGQSPDGITTGIIEAEVHQDMGGTEDSNTQIEPRLREGSPLHDEQSLDFMDLKFLSCEDKADHDITVKADPVVNVALPEAFSQDLFAEGISEDAGEEAVTIDDDSSSNSEDGSEVGGVPDIDDRKDSEKKSEWSVKVKSGGKLKLRKNKNKKNIAKKRKIV